MGSREELEKIVGAPAVDERPVRDLWPLAIMQERAGNVPPQVLVVRPAGREQVAALLRWATSHRVAVTPMGGGSGPSTPPPARNDFWPGLRVSRPSGRTRLHAIGDAGGHQAARDASL